MHLIVVCPALNLPLSFFLGFLKKLLFLVFSHRREICFTVKQHKKFWKSKTGCYVVSVIHEERLYL